MFSRQLLKLTTLAFAMMVFSLSQVAYSEDLPKASKRTNVEYYSVNYVKFKVGMVGKAMKIIDEIFVPASVEAGTPSPYMIRFQTGPWDVVMFWTQKNGMSDFDWTLSPDGEKWYKVFAKRSGGVEKAKKILSDYYALIATTRYDIGHHQIDPKEMASK